MSKHCATSGVTPGSWSTGSSWPAPALARRCTRRAGSETRIAAGDVEAAAEALGRPHRLEGLVIHGDHRGRELGYPTANLELPPALAVPADGVYAGLLDGMPAAVSVGTNPTFGGTSRRVEAYVIDEVGLDLYGRVMALDLVRRLRPMVTFEGIEALVAQMAVDVEESRRLLSGKS